MLGAYLFVLRKQNVFQIPQPFWAEQVSFLEFSHSLHLQFSLLSLQELGLFASSQFSIQQHLLCLLSLGIAREQFGFGQGNLRQTMKMHSCVRFQYPFITAEAPEAWFW